MASCNWWYRKVPKFKRAKPLVLKPKPAPKDPMRPLPPDLAWYVFVVTFNREYAIADWLESVQGLFTLVTLLTCHKLENAVRGGSKARRVAYQIPLFPRMVLVGFDEPPNWRKVMDNYHIKGVLGLKGTPVRMRAGEAERLRMNSEALRKAMTETKELEVGEKARIVAPGLFVNHVVEITSIQGKNAHVIQNWFGQKREVIIPKIDLERAA